MEAETIKIEQTEGALVEAETIKIEQEDLEETDREAKSVRGQRTDRRRSNDGGSNHRGPVEPEKKTKAPKLKIQQVRNASCPTHHVHSLWKIRHNRFRSPEGGASGWQYAYEKYNVHDPDRKDYSEYEYDCSSCI